MSRGGSSPMETPKIMRMPTSNDPTVLAARARSIASSKKRGGRASTILSNMVSRINGSQGNLGQ